MPESNMRTRGRERKAAKKYGGDYFESNNVKFARAFAGRSTAEKSRLISKHFLGLRIAINSAVKKREHFAKYWKTGAVFTASELEGVRRDLENLRQVSNRVAQDSRGIFSHEYLTDPYVTKSRYREGLYKLSHNLHLMEGTERMMNDKLGN